MSIRDLKTNEIKMCKWFFAARFLRCRQITNFYVAHNCIATFFQEMAIDNLLEPYETQILSQLQK